MTQFAVTENETHIAVVAPTVNDDASASYSEGDHWVDTVTNIAYICVDATTGAAVWTSVTAAAAVLSLQGSYDGSPSTNKTIALAAGAGEGLHIRDNVAPIGTTLFDVADSVGTTNYFSVDAAAAQFDVPLTINGKLTVTGLIDPTGLILDEQSTVPGGAPGAAKGAIWLRDDGPNSLVFTDDDGNEHDFSGVKANVESKASIIRVRKGSVGTINKGQAVYISGYNPSGWLEVELAQSNSASTMPAIGLAAEAITNSADCSTIAFGTLANFNTNAWAVGTELYVDDSVAGGLIGAKPTGATNLIQKVAQVMRQNVSVGAVEIFGAGRTNDIPNLTQNYIWQGDGSGVPVEVRPFGYGYDYQSSDGTSTTTSSSFQTKASVTVPAINGKWLIAWSCRFWNADDAGEVQLYDQTNAAILDGPYVYKLKDPGSNTRTSVGGVYEFTQAGAAATVAIEFKDQLSGNTQSISHARLTLWKVDG